MNQEIEMTRPKEQDIAYMDALRVKIKSYQKIIVTISETYRIMGEIDRLLVEYRRHNYE